MKRQINSFLKKFGYSLSKTRRGLFTKEQWEKYKRDYKTIKTQTDWII